MPPSGASYHFAISLGIAVLAGPAWASLRRSPRLLSMACSSFLAAMAAGIAKEIYDLIRNPWRLSPADLRSDSASDMVWNLAGALAGIFLIFLLCASVSAIARRFAGSGSAPPGVFRRRAPRHRISA